MRQVVDYNSLIDVLIDGTRRQRSQRWSLSPSSESVNEWLAGRIAPNVIQVTKRDRWSPPRGGHSPGTSAAPIVDQLTLRVRIITAASTAKSSNDPMSNA